MNKPTANLPQCVTHKVDMVFDHEESFLYVFKCPICHSYKTKLKNIIITEEEKMATSDAIKKLLNKTTRIEGV